MDADNNVGTIYNNERVMTLLDRMASIGHNCLVDLNAKSSVRDDVVQSLKRFQAGLACVPTWNDNVQTQESDTACAKHPDLMALYKYGITVYLQEFYKNKTETTIHVNVPHIKYFIHAFLSRVAGLPLVYNKRYFSASYTERRAAFMDCMRFALYDILLPQLIDPDVASPADTDQIFTTPQTLDVQTVGTVTVPASTVPPSVKSVRAQPSSESVRAPPSATLSAFEKALLKNKTPKPDTPMPKTPTPHLKTPTTQFKTPAPHSKTPMPRTVMPSTPASKLPFFTPTQDGAQYVPEKSPARASRTPRAAQIVSENNDERRQVIIPRSAMYPKSSRSATPQSRPGVVRAPSPRPDSGSSAGPGSAIPRSAASARSKADNVPFSPFFKD